ncbi:MAG: FAD-dependent oxidoreductase [Chloroflexi bacterium]|nr:FAD-dependent oxidoreductase [Chloroflexota bacterium]
MTTETAIIIGAGLAGLATALELHEAGWKTMVLEARHRVGGRVFTLRDGFTENQYAEGGGEFIEAFHPRLLDLVQRFGLQLETLGGMGDWAQWVALEGRVGRADDVSLWGVDVEAEMKKVWAALAGLGRHVPDPAQPQAAPEATRLDPQSAADWLRSLNVHSLAKKVFTARLRSEFIAEPEQLSLLDLARWGAFYYRDPDDDSPSFRIVGGNDQLPQAMASALPDLRLGAVVTEIQQDDERVRVTYRVGQTVNRAEADEAVLAIPLGPARAITFKPPLPPDHQAMLNGVTYGAVTKVLIQYRKRFWGEGDWNGSLLTDLPITCIWEPTRNQRGAGRILTVYTGAAGGAEFSAMSDDDRIALAIAQVEQAFPGSARHVAAGRTMAWRNEPFSQGGYASFAPGEVMAYWETLRRPAGRLHFVGEHTAVHQGYMEGAVESGQRVAGALRAKKEYGLPG